MAGKKKEKKKKRKSLTRQIIHIIIAAHFIAIALVLFISRFYLINETFDDATEIADVALDGAVQVVEALNMDYTKSLDPEVNAAIRESFTRFCKRAEIAYLYLYTIDKSGNILHLASASGIPENDERVRELYGNGQTENRELTDYENYLMYGGDIANNSDLIVNDLGYFFSGYMGLYDDDGNLEGILRADYDLSKLFGKMLQKIIAYLLVGVISFIITTISSVVRLRHDVVNPVKSLSKNMTKFTGTKEIVTLENKSKYLNEITDIESSFDTMQKEIKSYMDDIESLTRDKVQTQTQVDIARRIQLGIVPETSNYIKNHSYVYATSKPAIDVGGDFYDIFELDKRNICIVEADVSGKGISAALFMMMMRSIIREKIKSDKDLSRALSEVNLDVCSSNPELMFATVFALILDTLTGEIVYCNAGHNPPVFFDGAKAKELEVEPNVVVGFEGNSTFTSGSMKLKDGEGLYIYTDGVTEAINTSDEQFTIKRVEDTIKTSSKESPELIIKTITDNLNDFAKGKDQFDDITQIAILYKDSGQASESI